MGLILNRESIPDAGLRFSDVFVAPSGLPAPGVVVAMSSADQPEESGPAITDLLKNPTKVVMLRVCMDADMVWWHADMDGAVLEYDWARRSR